MIDEVSKQRIDTAIKQIAIELCNLERGLGRCVDRVDITHHCDPDGVDVRRSLRIVLAPRPAVWDVNGVDSDERD